VAGDWQVPGYHPIRDLGEGSTGRVVLAVHVATETPVAIKYLSPRLLTDEEFLSRFRGEARVLAGLDNPNLVRFHEYIESLRRDAPAGSPPRGAAIVMELVDGISLGRLLTNVGPTGPEAALTVLKGSLLGLAAAHSVGVVHRDYKPGNILISGDGASKLADFGLAVRAGDNVPAAGTPVYMPPEQWSGRPVTPATDVYAATAVFFECLTGDRPYPGQTLPQLALAHRTAPVPVERVPEPLQRIIAHGLAKAVHDRPQSAAAFLDELETTALAAYGPNWEERGRNRLAELAALLALLFPLAGGFDAQGGSAVAHTDLGTEAEAGMGMGVAGPDRSRSTARRFVVAAVSAVVVVILGGTSIAVYTASVSSKNRPAAVGPSVSVSGEPSTGPSTDPSADPSADPSSPSPTASGTDPAAASAPPGTGGGGLPIPPVVSVPGGPSVSLPPPPKPKPPPPALAITGLNVSVARDGRTGVASISVTTNGTGPISLSITWSSGETDTKSGSGARSYSFSSTAGKFESICVPWTVTVVGQPGGASDTATVGPDPQCEIG
jgi:hypothetical protein